MWSFINKKEDSGRQPRHTRQSSNSSGFTHIDSPTTGNNGRILVSPTHNHDGVVKTPLSFLDELWTRSFQYTVQIVLISLCML